MVGGVSNASQILSRELNHGGLGSSWMGVACIVLSMIVNALAIGLIAFRVKILKVYREVSKPTSGKYTSRNQYRNVISIIIESGMVLFCIQSVRTVLIGDFDPLYALQITITIHEILSVSTITIGHCYFSITWALRW